MGEITAVHVRRGIAGTLVADLCQDRTAKVTLPHILKEEEMARWATRAD